MNTEAPGQQRELVNSVLVGPEITSGSNFSLARSPDSREQADELFTKISAGVPDRFGHQLADQPRDPTGLNLRPATHCSGHPAMPPGTQLTQDNGHSTAGATVNCAA